MRRLDHLKLVAALGLAACASDPPVGSVDAGGAAPCGLVSTVIGSAEATGTGGAGTTAAPASSSSSASAGGGGATGEGGAAACGCPGDIAVRSGTRLEVLSARSVDRASAPVGLYDTALECPCSPELRPDGVWRCVPAAGCPAWTDEDLVELAIEAGP